MPESKGEGWPERLSRKVKKTVFTAVRRARVFRDKFRLRQAVVMAQIICKGSSEEKYFGENRSPLS